MPGIRKYIGFQTESQQTLLKGLARESGANDLNAGFSEGLALPMAGLLSIEQRSFFTKAGAFLDYKACSGEPLFNNPSHRIGAERSAGLGETMDALKNISVEKFWIVTWLKSVKIKGVDTRIELGQHGLRVFKDQCQPDIGG